MKNSKYSINRDTLCQLIDEGEEEIFIALMNDDDFFFKISGIARRVFLNTVNEDKSVGEVVVALSQKLDENSDDLLENSLAFLKELEELGLIFNSQSAPKDRVEIKLVRFSKEFGGIKKENIVFEEDSVLDAYSQSILSCGGCGGATLFCT